MRTYLLALILICFSMQSNAQKANKLIMRSGSIRFISDATLERIEAKSSKLNGLLILSDKTFAFTVENTSFNGFNGSLQQEHFNENYLESERFPRCNFTGKIVENVNFYVDGKYEVRAKGKLIIHGVEKDRIIKVSIEVKNGKINVNSKFNVLLEEHGIFIPTIVNQKISEEVQIIVQANFEHYE